MKHSKLNHNKQFMFGIMALALVLFGVVIFFWMWCFPEGVTPVQKKQKSEISVVGFQGEELQISVNDSVLYNGPVKQDTLELYCLVENSALLMVGEAHTGSLSSFEITEDQRSVLIYRDKQGALKIK